MHTFLPHCCVFVHAFLLSPSYGCCCCYSKSLELGFIMATRGATMMIAEIDSPTFPLITFIIHGKSRKMKVFQSPLEELRKRPGPGKRDSSKFSALQEKIPHTENARLHCLQQRRCLHDSITDVSLPPYRIPHQCYQCSSVNRRCHNRPIRGYTGIQYTGRTLC